MTVLAAGLSLHVRGRASGRHYSNAEGPPFVPGSDGVGRLDDGRRVYFAFPRHPFGSMAEHSVVADRHFVPLPDDLDDVTAAAIANPGMSSWAALSERARLRAGEVVLVNGATSASGRLAIQIAKILGAGRVVATARPASAEAGLRALGADSFIPLDVPRESLVKAFRHEILHGLAVVLDYLWGSPAEAFFAAAMSHGSGEAAPRIRYVNIGSMAGASIALGGASLRSSGLELIGSGLGSVSHTALLRCISDLMRVAVPARLHISAEPVMLSEVETAWARPAVERIVFVNGR